MNTQISKISEIMEDIKQDITNNQYKIIMDNLMMIQQTTFLYENDNINNFISLFKWLDEELEITDCNYDCIRRNDLHAHISFYFFNDEHYENIYFIELFLKLHFMHPTKKQGNHIEVC
jgi:hypothetical protein